MSDDYNKNLTQQSVEITGMANAILSTVVTIVLFYVTLGPGGARSQLSKTTQLFGSDCIPTGDGTTGFKEDEFMGGIESCDPTEDNNEDGVIDKLLNGTTSANFSGKQIKLGRMLIFIGILSNILYIFSPYLVFIPLKIWEIFLQYRANKCSNDQIGVKNKLEEIQQFKRDGKNISNVQNEYNKLIDEAYNECLNNYKKWNFFKPINSLNTNENKITSGGGNESGEATWLTVLTRFATLVGGEGCDYGESMRFFIGAVHIIIFLIFGALIKGDPLSISPGLFGVFLSLLIIFTVLGKLTPSDGMIQILYAMIGVVSFVVWLILFYINRKNKNPLTISSIVQYSVFVISFSCFAYFTGNHKNFIKSNNSSCPPQIKLDDNTQEMLNSFSQKVIDIVKQKTGIGHADGHAGGGVDRHIGGGTNKESIACLVYNFFSTINDSIALGLVKVVIIILGLIFTPNNKNSVKKTIKQIYSLTGRFGFFFSLTSIFIAVWDIFPLIKWFTSFNNSSDEKKDSKNNLFARASELSYLQKCNYNPSLNPGDDGKNCISE
tara:strand:+ start:5004 stop:6650 length:1647 start_codon:yes stop_codon:yes gene_type:complete